MAPSFPDDLLLHIPPNHEEENSRIVLQCVTTAFFCLLIFPRLFVTFFLSPTPTPSSSSSKKATGASGEAEKRASQSAIDKDAAQPGRGRGRGHHRQHQHRPKDEDDDTKKRSNKRSKKARGGGGGTAKGRGNKREESSVSASTPSSLSTDSGEAQGGKGASKVGEQAPPLALSVISTLSLLVAVPILLLNSPNNSYSARGVFRAPLLTVDECGDVIAMAERAAERNYRRASDAAVAKSVGGGGGGSGGIDAKAEEDANLLSKPLGWQKDRHGSYPTVDVNVVTDPFTDDDRDCLRSKLDVRLSPLIERVFNVVPRALRANDIFIVRYDGGTNERGAQTRLRQHTDSADISFNVLLSGSFEGGGTRFVDRRAGPGGGDGRHMDARPQLGEVLIHSSLLLHEGLPTTSGTRYILVGFISVDRRDPFTDQPTGLSPFASWLSVPWLTVKAKEGYNAAYYRMDSRRQEEVGAASDKGSAGGHAVLPVSEDWKWTEYKYARSLLRDIIGFLITVGDYWAPMFHVSLVEASNATMYLRALDQLEVARGGRPSRCGRDGGAGVGSLKLKREDGDDDPAESDDSDDDDDEADDDSNDSDGVSGRASWFRGQQIHLDLDGSVYGVYGSRRQIEEQLLVDLDDAN